MRKRESERERRILAAAAVVVSFDDGAGSTAAVSRAHTTKSNVPSVGVRIRRDGDTSSSSRVVRPARYGATCSVVRRAAHPFGPPSETAAVVNFMPSGYRRRVVSDVSHCDSSDGLEAKTHTR